MSLKRRKYDMRSGFRNTLTIERFENRLLLANYNLVDTLLPSNVNPQIDTGEGEAVAVGSQYHAIGKPDADRFRGAVEVYDAATNEHVATIENRNGTRNFGQGVAVLGSQVFVTDWLNLYAYEINNGHATLKHTVRDPGSAGFFGKSLALSGSTIAVGGRTSYAFDVSSGRPNLVATIKAPTSESIRFGWAIDIDGSTVVVGAFLQDVGARDSGSAYVYDISDGGEARLVAALNNPTPERIGYFGRGVAISGDTVAVGAEGDDTVSHSAGSVYLYGIGNGNAVLEHTITNPAADIGEFGRAVALQGTTLVVGDYGADGPVELAGRAYRYDISGTSPSLEEIIENPTPETRDHFGFAVDLLGDSIVVGAPSDNTLARLAGSAYVFDTGADEAKLTGTLNSPLPQINDEFGEVVALDGSIAVVGVPADDTGAEQSGSVYVFDVSGDTASLIGSIPNPTPDVNDHFGETIDVSGSIVVVGAPNADGLEDPDGEAMTGTVYVYEIRDDNVRLLDTILNPTPQRFETFGSAVGISGDTIVIGARGEDEGEVRDAGRVYFYDISSGTAELEDTVRNPSPANYDRFGSALDISGSTVVVGTANDDTGAEDAGSVYVFEYSQRDAELVNTISNPSPERNDKFGSAVAVSGEHIVVGDSPIGYGDAGSAYVYRLADDGSASLLETLNDPLSDPNEEFGISVAIRGSKVVVGSRQQDAGATDAGIAYVYEIDEPNSHVVLERTLHNPTPEFDDQFGHSVAISGNTLIVGAVEDNTKRPKQGAVYVYRSDEPIPEPPITDPDPPVTAPAPPASSPNLEVLYQNKERKVRANVIEAKLELYNRESSPTNLKDVVLRYKLDPDNLNPIVSVTSTNAPGGVDATFVEDGADSYVDFKVLGDFSVSPGKRLKLRFEIENEEGLPFDQSNDLSFKASQTSFGPANVDIILAETHSTPDPEPDPEPAPGQVAGIEVFYQNKAREVETNQIAAKLELYNRDSETKNFKGLEFRYRFDPDGLTPQVEITSTNAQGRIVSSIVNDGADSYVSFRIVEDFFVKSNRRLKLKFELANTEGELFNQANDLSFVASQTSLALADSIELDWLDE